MVQEEIEEHFRNICESCSPIIDNIKEVEDGSSSPKFANGTNGNEVDDEDLIGDLGNTSLEEGKRASRPIVKTKPKPRPVPHYLTGTAASRAMERPKSPMFLKRGAGQQKSKSPLRH